MPICFICAEIHQIQMANQRGEKKRGLASKAIEGSTLSLEGIHNIHGSDSFPLGMLSVGNGVTNDVLQEDLQDTSGLLIDETRDPLHPTPPSQTTDSGLGDPLDVVSQHFAVSLSTSLAQAFSTLASTSHCATRVNWKYMRSNPH